MRGKLLQQARRATKVNFSAVRLISFESDGRSSFGAITGDGSVFIDLGSAGFGSTLEHFVSSGDRGLAGARAIIEAKAIPARRLDEVTLLAPFPRPTHTLLCVGKNYREHAAEFHGSGFDSTAGANAVPDAPIIFVKHPSSVIANGAAIVASNDPTKTVDYEGELAVVIGKPAFRVAAKDAFAHVYGYIIANDVTSRELQSKHKQWFIGKSIDTFCPMGPYLVTADKVPDVGALRLQTFVNDELRQNALVADLIFDIPTLIETISATTTLESGDLLLTGTPAGVGIGFKPPVYLQPGDRVRITIDRLGELANPVS
jgi:2-keto-4-pentenoate hydratase/2-oxohepta-3-ene-1,7-dioic acid hydratase in catechol pathway